MSPAPKNSHTPHSISTNFVSTDQAFRGHFNLNSSSTHKSKTRPSSANRSSKVPKSTKVSTKKISLDGKLKPRKIAKEFDNEEVKYFSKTDMSEIISPSQEVKLAMQRIGHDLDPFKESNNLRSSQYTDTSNAAKETGPTTVESVFKDKW